MIEEIVRASFEERLFEPGDKSVSHSGEGVAGKKGRSNGKGGRFAPALPPSSTEHDSDFDPEKYRLGTLCRRGHDWRESGQSVRSRKNRCCRACVNEFYSDGAKPSRVNKLSPQEFLLQRIEIDETTGCWNWKIAMNWRCSRLKERKPFRASYKIFKGPIPDGKMVRRTCLNLRCVRPEHLELVDPLERNKVCYKLLKKVNRESPELESGAAETDRDFLETEIARIANDEFDTQVFELGSLCIRRHNWQNSGYSVRSIKQGNCRACMWIKNRTERKGQEEEG